MNLRTSRRTRNLVKRGSFATLQTLEPRQMLCYADGGGVIQHIGSRSHPTAEAAQLLQDAVVPVVQEMVIQPGKTDPSKPALETPPTRVLPSALQFNSLPGAPVSLYLNFEGQGESGLAEGFLGFGGFDVDATPAYDIDGNPALFSTTEAHNIERMWRVVAEKFSPLNVNVTTQQPFLTTGSVNYCTIVVGGNGSWYGKGGGVAVEGGYSSQNFFLPGQDSVGYVWRSPTNPDSMAEGIAHEAGHLFGLKHNSEKDFYGNITNEYRQGWIMGEGYGGATPGRWDIDQTSSYVDDGDVKNAGLQSDIATMMDESGLQRRADDHANGYFFATPLATTSSGRAGTGVHEIEGDKDYFSFTTTGGFMSITVSPAQFQAMDNLTLEIVGIATVNTASQGETWTSATTMSAGTYYVGVHSRGQIGDLGSYSIGVTLNEQFNNTVKTATPIGRFGEQPGIFGLVNPIYAGRGVIADFVGDSDPEDYYRIQTDNVTTRQTVWLYNLGADADVRLISDRNRNLQVDSGEVIALSQAGGTTGEAFTVDLTPNSTYYIHVYRYQSANTNYSLELRADGAGEQPRNSGLAARGPNIFAGDQTFYDQIDEYELHDVYRVRPDYPGLVDINLTGLGADADLRLAIDFNNNGVIEAGDTLYQSSLGGSNSEHISQIQLNPAWNAVGGYYVIVDYYAGNVTNYALNIHLDTTTSNGPNNLVHPYSRSLGDLSVNNYRSFDEYVGAKDTFDIFGFQAPAGLLSIRGTGTPHYRDLIRDLNGNGSVDAGEVVASGNNIDYIVPGAVGTSQTLYLRVQRAGGEFPTDGNYHQTMASQYSLPASDNTFGSARVLSLTTTTQHFGGYLQSDSFAPEFNDLDDYYTFTLSEAQRALFTLGGVAARSNGDRGLGVPLAGLQVIYDANGNGQLDNEERLAGQGVYGSRRSTSIETSLEAGTYFVRVFVERPERPDETAGARTNYTLDYAIVDAVEDPGPSVLSDSFYYETAPQGLIVSFSEDVSGTLTRDDVVVTDSIGNTIPFGSLFYDAATNQAYFSFVSDAYPSGLLPEGLYTVTIDGSHNLRDAAGIPLAAAFSDSFHVLLGDANRDRVIDFDDLLVVAQNYGNAGTFSQGDFDYDGTVDFDDLLILAQRYGTSLLSDWNAALHPTTQADRVTHTGLGVIGAEATPTRTVRRISDEIL